MADAASRGTPSASSASNVRDKCQTDPRAHLPFPVLFEDRRYPISHPGPAPPWPSCPRGGSGNPNLFRRLTRRLVGGERRRDCIEVIRGSQKGVGTRWRTYHVNINTLCCIVLIKVKLYHIPCMFALQIATSPVAPVLVSQGFQCIDFRKWRLSIGEMIRKCAKSACKAVIGLATFPTRTVIYIVLFRPAGTSE